MRRLDLLRSPNVVVPKHPSAVLQMQYAWKRVGLAPEGYLPNS